MNLEQLEQLVPIVRTQQQEIEELKSQLHMFEAHSHAPHLKPSKPETFEGQRSELRWTTGFSSSTSSMRHPT
jgi:hypothetical protein